MKNIYQKHRWPRRPISVAVEAGDFAEVERLAAGLAELSEPDANEETPLLLARNNLEMVEFLLKLGADPTVWPGVYTPPITYTKPDSELGQLLARYGYKPEDRIL